jgi:hypothetical protein
LGIFLGWVFFTVIVGIAANSRERSGNLSRWSSRINRQCGHQA